MTTAAPQPQDDTPMWNILREWLKHATLSAADKPSTLTRKQAAPLMRWIYTLEFTLRRLVFLAAIALAITFQPKPARASTHAATARPITPPRQTTNTFRLYPRDRRQQRATAHIPSRQAAAEPTQHPSHPRRPTAPIDTFLRPDRHHIDDDTPTEHRDDIDAPTPPAPKRAPIIYATQTFAERIAYLAQLIASPRKLIARAARALAARREIAARLSEACTPRARGILRTMRRVFNDLLAPLHNACGNALQQYAHADTS